MSDETTAIIAIVVLCVCVLILFWTPGHIARHRGHPSKEAIAICGWLGLFFFPLWLVAVVWAHTGPSRTPARATPKRRKHKLTRQQWNAVEALEEMA